MEKAKELSQTLSLLSNPQFNEFSPELLASLIVCITSKALQKINLCNILKKPGLSLLFQTANKGTTEKIRKLALRLICELTFENEVAQNSICNTFSFTPLQGKVSINSIPEKLKEKLRLDNKLLVSLKDQKNCVTKEKFWCFPPFSKEEKNTQGKEDLTSGFPDPQEYWICFNYSGEILHRPNMSDNVVSKNQNPSGSQSYREKIPTRTKKEIKKQSNSPIKNINKKLVDSKGHPPISIIIKKEEQVFKPTNVSLYLEEEKNLRNSIQLIMEKKKDVVESNTEFIPAGSGSESSVKLRNSIAGKPSSPFNESKEEKKEQKANSIKKEEIKKNFFSLNTLRVREKGKDIPAPNSSRGAKPNKVENRKNLKEKPTYKLTVKYFIKCFKFTAILKEELIPINVREGKNR